MQKSVATIKQLLRDVQAGRGRPKRGRPKKAPDEHEIARVPYYIQRAAEDLGYVPKG